MSNKNTEPTLNNQLLAQLEEKLINKQIIMHIKEALNVSQKKSIRNKRKHFIFKMGIIILSAIITFVNTYSYAHDEVICMKDLSIILPIILTTLLSIQALRKYEETWMRHQNYHLRLQLEIISYINAATDKYNVPDANEAEKIFKKSIEDVFKGNQEHFNKNMKRP